MFEFDFLSLLCNLNTLWNILMMLGTNVEQDEMTCCRIEGDICFFLKIPFLVGISVGITLYCLLSFESVVELLPNFYRYIIWT